MTGDRTPDERRVSDALHDTVDHLEPTGGLSSIRARLQEDPMSAPRRSSRNALLALGGAAAVAILTTGIVLVTQDDGRPSGALPPAGSTSQTPAPTPTDDPSQPDPSADDSTPPPSPPAPTATRKAVPVYYVGTTPVGPRLYREFHNIDTTEGMELEAAVAQAIGVAPYDPDYRSPWPEGTSVNSVTSLSSAQEVVIDLSGDLRTRPSGMSEDEAGMAVQQLIYTAQAVVQDRVPVSFLVDGKKTDTILGVAAAEPLSNDDEMSTTATVWVITPQDGAQVPAGDVRVTGRGAFFEATVVWQLLAADGTTVVERGSGMSQECCVLSPYDFTITGVQPGDYVLRVYDEDMSGGEGPGEMQDTKRITVG